MLPHFQRPIITQKYEYSTLADPVAFPCEMLIWPHADTIHMFLTK